LIINKPKDLLNNIMQVITMYQQKMELILTKCLKI